MTLLIQTHKAKHLPSISIFTTFYQACDAMLLYFLSLINFFNLKKLCSLLFSHENKYVKSCLTMLYCSTILTSFSSNFITKINGLTCFSLCSQRLKRDFIMAHLCCYIPLPFAAKVQVVFLIVIFHLLLLCYTFINQIGNLIQNFGMFSHTQNPFPLGFSPYCLTIFFWCMFASIQLIIIALHVVIILINFIGLVHIYYIFMSLI